MYSYYSSDELHYVVNDKVLTVENRDKLSKIKEEDNPVILRYKFKK